LYNGGFVAPYAHGLRCGEVDWDPSKETTWSTDRPEVYRHFRSYVQHLAVRRPKRPAGPVAMLPPNLTVDMAVETPLIEPPPVPDPNGAPRDATVTEAAAAEATAAAAAANVVATREPRRRSDPRGVVAVGTSVTLVDDGSSSSSISWGTSSDSPGPSFGVLLVRRENGAGITCTGACRRSLDPNFFGDAQDFLASRNLTFVEAVLERLTLRDQIRLSLRAEMVVRWL